MGEGRVHSKVVARGAGHGQCRGDEGGTRPNRADGRIEGACPTLGEGGGALRDELARSAVAKEAEAWAVTCRAAVHRPAWPYGVATATGMPGAPAGANIRQGEQLETHWAGDVRVSGLSDLRDLLAWTEIVVLATSLNPSSRGLLGRAELTRLAKGTFLVNVSRGELLDEAALVDALSSGSLDGAVLDTTAVEPLPHDHALWQLENA